MRRLLEYIAMSGWRWGVSCLLTVLFGFAIVLWMAGCGDTSQPFQLRDSVGTVVATLILNPELPLPMQDTTLAVRLLEDGQPVIGATVAMTLTMPGCPMAPSYPILQEEGDGFYKTQTVLTMAGAWQADAKVTFLSGRSELFTFFFATK